jgi:hypothetical protein
MVVIKRDEIEEELLGTILNIFYFFDTPSIIYLNDNNVKYFGIYRRNKDYNIILVRKGNSLTGYSIAGFEVNEDSTIRIIFVYKIDVPDGDLLIELLDRLPETPIDSDSTREEIKELYNYLKRGYKITAFVDIDKLAEEE